MVVGKTIIHKNKIGNEQQKNENILKKRKKELIQSLSYQEHMVIASSYLAEQSSLRPTGDLMLGEQCSESSD